MMDWITSATAGVWPIVGHYGFGAVAVAGLVAASYFSPLFKKELLWVAGLVAAGTVCYAVGVNDGKARVQAQWDAARRVSVKKGEAARAGAIRDVAREPSRWVPDKRDLDLRD